MSQKHLFIFNSTSILKRFILRLTVFVFPIAALLILSIVFYIFTDPFEVVWRYDTHLNSTSDYQITTNRDFKSTQLFLLNYKKNNYDSFILGNSRSLFYQIESWNKYIKGNGFHFDASNESLYGVDCKLRLLSGLDVKIKNVLIVLDTGLLRQVKNSEGHLFVKHPMLSKESYLTFHYKMFRGFFPNAVIAYADLFFNGKKKYMLKYGIMDTIWEHDSKTNQLKLDLYDHQIKTNPGLYYSDKINDFHKRAVFTVYSEPVIQTQQERLLKNINTLLKIHKTNFKIIISPLYDQVKINKRDLNYLKNLFGSENVYDFSGINKITSDYHNYYETSHYRPVVCDSILKIIYTK